MQSPADILPVNPVDFMNLLPRMHIEKLPPQALAPGFSVRSYGLGPDRPPAAAACPRKIATNPTSDASPLTAYSVFSVDCIILPILLALSAALATASADHGDELRPLERVAFGSCNRPWHPCPVWEPVARFEPQLWIWLGDIVYAKPGDLEDLRNKFAMQRASPGYARILSSCTVMGIWDDHDYGQNDGNATNPIKRESKNLMLDFLNEPAGSARRAREGAYDSRVFGPPGQQTHVILLDGRWWRTAPGRKGDTLGEPQWEWLENQLASSPAQLLLIGTGTQILPEDHPFEKWADYPVSRSRLLALLARSRAHHILLLTGDRHLAEISRATLPGRSTPIFEVTSSGMTHVAKPMARSFWHDFSHERNRHRLGHPFVGRNAGLLTIAWDGSHPHLRIAITDDEGRIRCAAETSQP